MIDLLMMGSCGHARVTCDRSTKSILRACYGTLLRTFSALLFTYIIFICQISRHIGQREICNGAIVKRLDTVHKIIGHFG